MHGIQNDGLSWFERSDASKNALPMRLFDEGYDVYVANLRGTFSARGHDSLDPDNEPDF